MSRGDLTFEQRGVVAGAYRDYGGRLSRLALMGPYGGWMARHSLTGALWGADGAACPYGVLMGDGWRGSFLQGAYRVTMARLAQTGAAVKF